MEQLRQEIGKYTDEYLIDQYIHHREDYTAQAAALLGEEIKKRGLELTSPIATETTEPQTRIVQLDSKDFTPFDHLFNRMDLQIAATILHDNGIPFYADNPNSTATFPIESEALMQFAIHVHVSAVEKAHALLDEHFEKIDGQYQLRKMGIREQLLAFNFHDLHMSELEAAQTVNVTLTPEETKVIAGYGKRILKDVERIEQEQDRVIFYYDSIPTLIEHIIGHDDQVLSKTDLLTILEILQIFCKDEEFPPTMDEPISTLLGFFLS